jgi:hypothetical protein
VSDALTVATAALVEENAEELALPETRESDRHSRERRSEVNDA